MTAMPKQIAGYPLPRMTIIRTMVGIASVIALIGCFFLLFSRLGAPNVTFISLDGEKITSQSLRGKVVLVNFWATSCSTCIHEMPKMVATYNQFKNQGLELVAVAMSYDAPNYVIDYTQTRRLPFKVAYDANGELAKSFGGVDGTPTTFVIDKNGVIIRRYEGEPTFSELDQLLSNALKV
ncbi:MAG: peroxiredoxin family protein [Burkholderiaceae bacterium]